MGTRAVRNAWQVRSRRRRTGGADEAFVQSLVFQRTAGQPFQAPRHILGSPADQTPVSAVMTTAVTCVRKDLSIEALTALLVEKHISGVPVIDDEGRAFGVVSKTDLIRDRHENGDTVELEVHDGAGRLDHGFHEVPMSRRTVGDIMTPIALTVHEHASISCAAALMATEGLHRLVVVADDGKVVGIVTALDIMRWLATHDGYLRAPRRRST